MSLTLDTSLFERRVAALAAQLPREVSGPVLTEEAAQFLRTMLRFLPPRTLAQGRAAASRDVRRAIAALDPRDFKEPSIRRILLSGNMASIQALVDRLPTTRGKRVAPLSPELHTSKRDRRGRVSKRTVPTLVAGRGSSASINRYVRAVQSRVGFLKSGYTAASRRLGVPVPNFIGRHPQVGQGSIDVRLTTGPEQSITITNRAGRYPGHSRAAADALRSRAAAIRTKTLRLLQGKAVNLGFTRLP
jgi:hypothetical protein